MLVGIFSVHHVVDNHPTVCTFTHEGDHLLVTLGLVKSEPLLWHLSYRERKKEEEERGSVM